MSGLFTSLAVMISPRGLSALGNGAGMGGVVFMGLLVLAAFASIYTAKSMESLGKGVKRATPFDIFALGFLDSSRIFTLTVLAVSWLGIAGYAVNEIFFLWFPNLGASFLLLGLAAAACIYSDDEGMDMYTICLTLGFAAFVYIALMSTQPLDTGMGYPASIPAVFSPLVPEVLLQSDAFVWMNLVFVTVLIFLGFDLPLAFELKGSKVVPAILFVLGGFLIFSWGALLLESPADLIDTAVPHLKVARATMGEVGRSLMGGTIILGTIAALVSLFQIAGLKVKGIFAQDYARHATRVAAFVLAAVITALLATGWAGEDALESLISAGLCFWFGSYALVDLLHLIGLRRAGGGFISTLISLLVLFLHGLAATVSAMYIEFPMHFYYAVGGMAVAGIVFGIGHYRSEAPMRAAEAERKALEEAESSEGEDNIELEAASEDEGLNIVDYK